MFNLDFALITRFGPDREYELPILEESLKRLKPPVKNSRLILCDSSGSGMVRQRLFEIGEEMGWLEVLYIPFKGIVKKEGPRPREYSYVMARLMNQAVTATRNARFVFTLDSDTLVPDTTELGGKTVLERFQPLFASGKVAVVGSSVPSRHQDKINPSVYRMESVWPFKGFHYASVKETGIEKVDAFGTACTMWNGDLVRSVGFEGCPNLTGEEKLGWEWYFHKTVQHMGYEVLVDWGVKPKHFKTPWDFVRA